MLRRRFSSTRHEFSADTGCGTILAFRKAAFALVSLFRGATSKALVSRSRVRTVALWFLTPCPRDSRFTLNQTSAREHPGWTIHLRRLTVRGGYSSGVVFRFAFVGGPNMVVREAIVAASVTTAGLAGVAAAEMDFERQVRPLLLEHCVD